MVKKRAAQKRFFSPGASVTFPEFVIAAVVFGLFTGVGQTLASMITKGFAKRELPEENILHKGAE